MHLVGPFRTSWKSSITMYYACNLFVEAELITKKSFITRGNHLQKIKSFIKRSMPATLSSPKIAS